MDQRKAIIFGAGPAGLAAAYELLERTDIRPVIMEMTGDVGGISRTVPYKGNRIDIGGHRFFSKSDRVMAWWENILPLQRVPAGKDLPSGRMMPISQGEDGPDPEKTDKVLLVRNRVSHIYFLKKFFDYPLSLSFGTLQNLGASRSSKIVVSYLKSALVPIRNEKNLEDFFINRFGKELYLTFFKDYTEKVWGIPCTEISNEWGIQRVKGLSLSKVLLNSINMFISKASDVTQRKTETSLIERFFYPKFGPGQLWEEVANRIRGKGGEILLNRKIVGISHRSQRVVEVKVKDEKTGEVNAQKGDYFFSSMPIRDLITAFDGGVPGEVLEVARGLQYRAFVTVGLILKKLKIKNHSKTNGHNGLIPDNWVYIQGRQAKLGRLQIYNNWSPYLVQNPHTVLLGLEYFCDEGDGLWNKSNGELTRFAIKELEDIGFIEESDVFDSLVVKMPKTYPAYFGTYNKLDRVRGFLDPFENLYCMGRNGMHRYNNMDHSILTAMAAVDNIINRLSRKDNLWAVNTEAEYWGK